MKFLSILVIAFVIMVPVSCNTDDPVAGKQEDTFIQNFLMARGDTIEPDEHGIYHLSVDEGHFSSGNIMSIQYKLFTLEGDTIDIIPKNDTDTIMHLRRRAGAIYPDGMEIVLQQMMEGETRSFILPSRLAYGNNLFSSLIPENAIIAAELEVVEIRDDAEAGLDQQEQIDAYMVDQNWRDTVTTKYYQPEFLTGTGIAYQKMTAGQSGTKPASRDTVEIKYKITTYSGWESNEGFPENYAFIVDEGEVIRGLEIAVKEMEVGEQARFIIPSEYAYKESAAVIPDFQEYKNILVENQIIPTYAAKVKPYEILLVDLELINVR